MVGMYGHGKKAFEDKWKNSVLVTSLNGRSIYKSNSITGISLLVES